MTFYNNTILPYFTVLIGKTSQSHFLFISELELVVKKFARRPLLHFKIYESKISFQNVSVSKKDRKNVCVRSDPDGNTWPLTVFINRKQFVDQFTNSISMLSCWPFFDFVAFILSLQSEG